jgi:hypothetical protein
VSNEPPSKLCVSDIERVCYMIRQVKQRYPSPQGADFIDSRDPRSMELQLMDGRDAQIVVIALARLLGASP